MDKSKFYNLLGVWVSNMYIQRAKKKSEELVKYREWDFNGPFFLFTKTWLLKMPIFFSL